MGGILSHQSSQKHARATRPGHTTVVVQTNSAPTTEVKEAIPEQTIQATRMSESPTHKKEISGLSEDPHANLPPTPKRPSSKHSTSKPSTPKSGTSKPSTPKMSQLRSPPPIPPLATGSLHSQNTENRAQSSVPSFPPINQQPRYYTSAGYSPTGLSPRKNTKPPGPKTQKISATTEYSAPGYIEQDYSQRAMEVKSRKESKTSAEEDAILIDLTPGNTPRNSESNSFANTNSKSSFSADRRNTGRDGFDNEKFRQVNSRKTNHTRDHDFETKPSVSSPIHQSYGSSGGKIDASRMSESNMHKPKFMGPGKQVFPSDDEILLEDLLDVGR